MSVEVPWQTQSGGERGQLGMVLRPGFLCAGGWFPADTARSSQPTRTGSQRGQTRRTEARQRRLPEGLCTEGGGVR